MGLLKREAFNGISKYHSEYTVKFTLNIQPSEQFSLASEVSMALCGFR